MGDHFYGKVRSRFGATGVGTNAGVTVTQSAAADAARHYVVTGIQCSGDLAALVTIESPAATVIWRKRMTGTGWQISERFEVGTVVGAQGGAVLVKISASTAACEANIQGAVV